MRLHRATIPALCPILAAARVAPAETASRDAKDVVTKAYALRMAGQPDQAKAMLSLQVGHACY